MSNLQRQIILLEEFAVGKYPRVYGENVHHDHETCQELYQAGLVSCSNPSQIRGVPGSDCYVNPRITVQGREQLDRWKERVWEKSLWGRVYSIIKTGTLWIGILIGAIIVKAAEWGVEHVLSRHLP